MTTVADLEPATQQLTALVHNLPDKMLDAPTPCPAFRVGDLVEHISGLALAFAAGAKKDTECDAANQAPSGNASRLADRWRDRIPQDLASLADAWRDPDAWTGITRVGGVDLPGEVAGLFALDEVVIHGWDLARASGQPYDADRGTLEALLPLLAQFATPGEEAAREGLFGPVVAIAPDAPLLDRVLGLTGRDPAWSPR
jgi:uncharacterized protein (TIGR03086 family)